MVPLAVAIAAGGILAVALPREYLSDTTIGITTPTVSPDLARVSTQFGRDERIRAISQQLLSKTVLERVVRDEHLASDPEGVAQQVARLRANVQPVTVPPPIPGSDPSRADAFILSYVDSTQDAAQRITGRLAQVFVDETSKRREIRAQDTTQFLSNQLALSRIRQMQLEERLSTAKRQYMGRLPEQSGANLQTLNGLRQQLDSTDNALRSEQDRLSMIDSQLVAMRQGADTIPVLPGSVPAPPSSPQARVLALQRQLADARMVYTEKHPEVMRLQEELKTARAEAAADLAKPESDRDAVLKSDPGYRQLLSDQENGRMRVRDLQRAEAQLRAQIGDLKGAYGTLHVSGV
jgi:hypothetical protein